MFHIEEGAKVESNNVLVHDSLDYTHGLFITGVCTLLNDIRAIMDARGHGNYLRPAVGGSFTVKVKRTRQSINKQRGLPSNQFLERIWNFLDGIWTI